MLGFEGVRILIQLCSLFWDRRLRLYRSNIVRQMSCGVDLAGNVEIRPWRIWAFQKLMNRLQ